MFSNIGTESLSITKGNPQLRPTPFKSRDRQSQMHHQARIMPLDNVLEVSTAVRPLNKHYQEDMKRTVRYPRLFLGLLGVWPILPRDLSTTKQYIIALRTVVFFILLSFIIIPPLFHIILIEKDTRLRFVLLVEMSFHLTNFLKYVFFLLRSKTIKLCVEHVETDWKLIVSEEDRAIMKSTASVGRRLMMISFIFSWSTGISYHTIMPIVSGKTLNEINETVRPIAYTGFDIFFNPQLHPTYEIISLTICASAFVSFTVTSASCSFTTGFVSHACGLLQIVISRLEVLVDSIEINKNEKQLQNQQTLITESHVRVLKLTSGIEKAIREICFMEVVSSSMILCNIEYYLITERNDTEVRILSYVIALFMYSFNIWLFCYIGELLKEQGRRVGEAAYMIDWYKLPYKSSQDLIMTIIMSNNCPPEITAGRVFELSICTFGYILKVSVTYCNVVRALTA